MTASFGFRTVDDALPALMAAVLDTGVEVDSRVGRTKELTHVTIELLEPWKRGITQGDRRASLPAQIAETMWVLAGRNDVAWLSHYLPRAADFSDDGEVWRGGYGPRIRDWQKPGVPQGKGTDQLGHVVELLRSDPGTRRAVINIYDPAVDTHPGKDIPCNNWLHFLNRDGALDLAVTIRSNDLMWGWSGINSFEWSALQEIVAGLVGLEVGSLVFHISSLHLYERHWEKARRITERPTTRPTYEGPRFSLSDSHGPWSPDELDGLIQAWFQLEEQIRTHQWPLTELGRRIDRFLEPMLQSWLRVLVWWWNPELPSTVIGNHALGVAASLSPGRPQPEAIVQPGPGDRLADLGVPDGEIARVLRENQPRPSFVDYVSALHAEKHAAYGDSWKRRGEMLGIMANIARKVDRLGGAETSDETSTDTAIDLLVYLIKYRLWLAENLPSAPWPIDPVGLSHVEEVSAMLRKLPTRAGSMGVGATNRWLADKFDELELEVADQRPERYALVDRMIVEASNLAQLLYWQQGNATRSWNPEA